MKKSLFLTSMLAIALIVPSTAAFAENTNSPEKIKKPAIEKEFPKLYDKNGKELTAPPKKGEKVYDKNGKELPPPPFMKKEHQRPDLKLTEEQKAKADKIREKSKKKIKPIRKDIRNLKDKIWDIKEDEKLTPEQKEAKIKPIAEKIRKLHEKANKIRQEDMQKFEKLLNDDQKKILENFKKTHKPPMKNPNGHRMPPPPPEEK